MKKIVSLFCITILLLIVAVFTIPAADSGVDTSSADKDGDSGDGGTTLWDRVDVLCLDLIKEKTYCYSGGQEQCTAKYCN